MNSLITQFIALTCNGNAFISDYPVPQFFPNNSICQRVNSIRFVEYDELPNGEIKETVIANTPDEWFLYLKQQKAIGIRLHYQVLNEHNIPDWQLAGIAGGSGLWAMEVLLPNEISIFYVCQVTSLPWRYKYGFISQQKTLPYSLRTPAQVKDDFKHSLLRIEDFAKKNNYKNFAIGFARALLVLTDPTSDRGLRSVERMIIPGAISTDSILLLKAASASWVFDTMESWNDLAISDDDIRQDYCRVSEDLYSMICEAIIVSATSTLSYSSSKDT